MRKVAIRHRAETEAKANLFANQCTVPQERYQARKASEEDVENYMKASEARIALALQKGLYK